MDLPVKDSPVIEKARELCQTLLEQDSFHDIRRRIDLFAADESTRAQYNRLCDQQDMLQEKDAQGIPLTDEDVESFERDRDALFANPVARDFMEAQKELNDLQQTVNQYISQTFKLGRVPTAADLQTGKCGPSCSCH
jgi:cell fate (sporulation/competence/biofilm development) regulator YlbF (YheA/YmcA/DUF963 family)